MPPKKDAPQKIRLEKRAAELKHEICEAQDEQLALSEQIRRFQCELLLQAECLPPQHAPLPNLTPGQSMAMETELQHVMRLCCQCSGHIFVRTAPTFDAEEMTLQLKEVAGACRILLTGLRQDPLKALLRHVQAFFGHLSGLVFCEVPDAENLKWLAQILEQMHRSSVPTDWALRIRDAMAISSQQEKILQRKHSAYLSKVEGLQQGCRSAADQLSSTHSSEEVDTLHLTRFLGALSTDNEIQLLRHYGECLALLTEQQLARGLVASYPLIPDLFQLIDMLPSGP